MVATSDLWVLCSSAIGSVSPEPDLKPPGVPGFEDANLVQGKEEFEPYKDLAIQEDDNGRKVKLLLYLTGKQPREVCSTLKLTIASKQS